MNPDTLIGALLGTGGTGILSLLITSFLSRRKNQLENEDTVISRLEKENTRLFTLAEERAVTASKLQDEVYRLRGLLGRHGIEIPEDTKP